MAEVTANPPRPSRLPSAIHKLRSYQIPAKRIALRFGTTADNVYQIDSRPFRASTIPQAPDVAALIRKFEDESEWELLKKFYSPSRFHPAEKSKLELKEHVVDSEFLRYQKNQNYEKGVAALSKLVRIVAAGGTAELLRLKAKLYQHIAWLNMQLGRSSSSVRYAAKAMQCASDAFSESLG